MFASVYWLAFQGFRLHFEAARGGGTFSTKLDLKN